MILILFLTGAVFTDLYRDKIYNLWVIPGMIAGIAGSALAGQNELISCLTAIGITFAILLPVYLLKGIAAGDVKLFMSAASFLSVQDTMSCIIMAFFVAGLISLSILLFKRNKKKTIHFAVPVLVSAIFTLGGVVV